MGMEFGTEYDASPTGPSSYSLDWTLSKFTLSGSGKSVQLVP
jgi:hypothetical protein